MAVLCAGCATKATKVLVVPMAPIPPPDPPALIFPQTALELPDPQPVPPEAILKRETPVQPVVSGTPPVRTPPRRPATTSARRETETSETPALTSQPPESSRPANRTPLVPVDPNLPGSDMIQKRLAALRAMQERLSRKKGGNAEMIRSRIQYFIDQAAKALARKDLRQADSLASRAEVLAEDLLSGR